MITSTPQPITQYDFGTNWLTFVEGHVTDERIEQAKVSLTEFIGVSTLKGRTFLDIGCGSGLFSLAALQLGADRVVSIDVNTNSVRCANELKRRAHEPSNWTVHEGSVLDQTFMESLGEHDIVYSWGVLHHTGSMWDAIRMAAGRVRPGGLFYIAIYNTADGLGFYSDGRIGSSAFWLREKRMYVSLPLWAQRCMDWTAAAAMVGGYLLRLQNPIRLIREHKINRGMSWMVDIRDWLGGYPYEHATAGEIFRFCRETLDLTLINLKSTNSLMNNEFLFQRPSANSR